jgi:hypothetical protein
VPKVPNQLQFATIAPGQAGLSNFTQMLNSLWRNLANVINGNISFGNGSQSDNISGVWLTAVFVTPNVDTTFNHTLGRKPIGYIPMNKTAACDVYSGSIPATTTQITLRGTAAASVGLFLV